MSRWHFELIGAEAGNGAGHGKDRAAMAGDWIPIELSLSRKSEVIRLARLTGRSKAEVIGLLVQFWGWASEETADGGLVNIDKSDLSTAVQGSDDRFWDALVDVRWLEACNGGFRVPNADRWLTNGAKARLASTRRKQVYRSRPTISGTNVGQTRDKRGTKAGPEKRREEKRREKKNPHSPLFDLPVGFDSPAVRASLEEWLAFKREQGKPYKPKGLAALIKQWSSRGPPAFIQAVEHSMAQNYQGLYCPGDSRGNRTENKKPTRTDKRGRATW